MRCCFDGFFGGKIVVAFGTYRVLRVMGCFLGARKLRLLGGIMEAWLVTFHRDACEALKLSEACGIFELRIWSLWSAGTEGSAVTKKRPAWFEAKSPGSYFSRVSTQKPWSRRCQGCLSAWQLNSVTCENPPSVNWVWLHESYRLKPL